MKKNKIISILDGADLKTYINQNITAYKIVQKLSLKLGKDNTPSETAITAYIKNRFNLRWDVKNRSWISYQDDKDSNTICNKKSFPKVTDNITISHESEIIEDDTLQEYKKEALSNENNYNLHKEKNSIKQSISPSLPSITKNEDKYDTACSTACAANNSIDVEQTIKSKERRTYTNLHGLNDEFIDPSEYAKYVTALSTEKFSISLSRFVIELIEQRISKGYNIKRQGNRSKIIQLALLEYLRLTK